MIRSASARVLAAAVLVATLLATASGTLLPSAHAELPLPAGLDAVGVDTPLGTALDPALRFVDEAGRPVRLGSVFDGVRPVVLVLAWYRCRMLCGLVLAGVADAARVAVPPPGETWRLLTVSYDAGDTPEDAREARGRALAKVGREVPWDFWTGDTASITSLLHGLGVRVARSPDTGELLHPVVVYALTPDARVARVLGGPGLDPGVLADALAAARGPIPVTAPNDAPAFGSAGPQICARPADASPLYDNWIRLAAGAAVLGLASLIAAIERRSWRSRR